MQRQVGDDVGGADAYLVDRQQVVQLTGESAEFVLLGVGFAGTNADQEAVQRLVEQLRPEIVVVQLCATRMALSKLYGRDRAALQDGGAPGGMQRERERAMALSIGAYTRQMVLSKVDGLDFFDWVLTGLLALASPVRVRPPFGAELVRCFALCADHQIRVVLGDRELSRTMERSWVLLTFMQKAHLLISLFLATMVPGFVRNTFGFNAAAAAAEEATEVARDDDSHDGGAAEGKHSGESGCTNISNQPRPRSDAYSAMLSTLCMRYGGLREIDAELSRYLVSTLQQVDASLKKRARLESERLRGAATAGGADGGDSDGVTSSSSLLAARTRVLVVLGHGFVPFVVENFHNDALVTQRPSLLQRRPVIRNLLMVITVLFVACILLAGLVLSLFLHISTQQTVHTIEVTT